MDITILLQGLFLGCSLIIPIGAQNAFILKQGIKRNNHFTSAGVCVLCDILLITLGIFIIQELFIQNSTAATILTYCGIIFLLAYGLISLKSAWSNHYTFSDLKNKGKKQKLTSTILMAMAVTLLNPQAYLDTVVILGGASNQYDANDKFYFAIGTMLASLLWLFSLAIGAEKLSPWLGKQKTQRMIDISVGAVMLLIAYNLYLDLQKKNTTIALSLL